MQIGATSASRAATEMLSVGAGVILGVSTASPTAAAARQTQAEVLGDVVGAGAGTRAGSLAVTAASTDRAASFLTSGSGGIVNVAVSGATAAATPEVFARVGADRTVDVAVDLTLSATGTAEADAAVTGGGGGVVNVQTMDAHATSRPRVSAEVGDRAVVTAGGTVTLSAATPLTLDRSNQSRAESGDGFTTASSAASGGGVVTVQDADSTTSVSPVTTTRVGVGTRVAAGSVALTATGQTGAEVLTVGAGGGFVSAGGVEAVLTDTPTVSNTVADGARIDAGSISLSAVGRFEDYGRSSANIGGFVAITSADTDVRTEFTVVNRIGTGAALTAAGELAADAVTYLTATGRSDATAGGAGADTRSSNSAGEPDAAGLKGVRVTGVTRSEVGGNAVLTADAVRLAGRVEGLTARMEARSRAAGLGSNADAVANVDVNDEAGVSLAYGAVVTGRSRVDLTARHDNLNATSHSDAVGASAFGDSDSTSIVDVDSASRVTAAAGARVVTHDFGSNTYYRVAFYDRRADQGGGIDFGSQRERGDFNVLRETDWRADLEITGRFADRRLVIAADGTVELNQGMTPIADASGHIYAVDPGQWTAADAGSVTFTANRVPAIDGRFAPESTFSTGLVAPTFTFAESPRAIEIVDRRPNPGFLQITNIDTVRADPAPRVTLGVESVPVGLGLLFHVRRAYAPTAISVDTNANIIVNRINNPVGTTVLRSAGTVGFDQIITHALEVRAGQDAGVVITEAPAGGPAVSRTSEVQLTYTSAGVPALTVVAGVDVHLTVTGLQRVPGAFTADVHDLYAGRRLNVTVNPIRTQYGGGAVGPVVVEKTQPSTNPLSVPAGTRNVNGKYLTVPVLFGVNLDPPVTNTDVFGGTLGTQPGTLTVRGRLEGNSETNLDLDPTVYLDYLQFRHVGTLPAPLTTASVLEFANFTGDGRLDLAVVSGTRLSLLANETGAGGGFREVYAIDTGAAVTAVAWGDADADGFLDLAVQFGGQTLVLLNSASGFTGSALTLPPLSGSAGALAWGDFDNDLAPDLLDVGPTGAVVHRFQDGVYAGQLAVLPAGYTKAGVGDYDQDGDLDVLLGGGDRVTRLFRNDGGAFVDSLVAFPATVRGPVLFGDGDGDGDLDVLVLGKPDAAGLAVASFYRNESGDFRLADSLTDRFDSLLWYDHDRDGDLDVLAHLTGPDRTRLYVNTPVAGGRILFAVAPREVPDGVALGAWAAAPLVGGPGVDLVYAGAAGGVPSVDVYQNAQPVPDAAPPAPVSVGANQFGSRARLFWTPPAGTTGGASPYTYDLHVSIWSAAEVRNYVVGNAAGRGALSGTSWTFAGLRPNDFVVYTVVSVDASGRRGAGTTGSFAVPGALVVNVGGGLDQDVDDGDILNGRTTLREAINYSNAKGGGFAIEVNVGLGAPITVNQLAITASVTITGVDRPILTANGTDRVFVVDDGTAANIDVALSGLFVRGGRADYGGAVYSTENLSLSRVTFWDNAATVDGGAVYARVPVGGRLDVADVNAYNPTAAPGDGLNQAGRNGGVLAIDNFGVVTFRSISGDLAQTFYAKAVAGSGGGIWLRNAATGQVRSEGGSEVMRVQLGSAGQDGGGVAIINDGGFVDLSGVTTSSNEAARGGGVFVRNSGGTVVLGRRQTGGRAALGGGYYVENIGGSVTLLSGSAEYNTATSAGGGVYLDQTGGTFRVERSLVIGNQSQGTGGGLFLRNDGGQVAFDTVSVPENVAAGPGGGLAYTGTGGLTISGSTFSGVSATRGAGIDAVLSGGTFALTSSTLSGTPPPGRRGPGPGCTWTSPPARRLP